MPYEDKDLLPPTIEEIINAIFGPFDTATIDEAKVVCLAAKLSKPEAETFLRRLKDVRN